MTTDIQKSQISKPERLITPMPRHSRSLVDWTSSSSVMDAHILPSTQHLLIPDTSHSDTGNTHTNSSVNDTVGTHTSTGTTVEIHVPEIKGATRTLAQRLFEYDLFDITWLTTSKFVSPIQFAAIRAFMLTYLLIVFLYLAIKTWKNGSEFFRWYFLNYVTLQVEYLYLFVINGSCRVFGSILNLIN
jgi:hypothetical protein